MDNAYQKVKSEGWAVARAAREYGVPRVTLLDKLSERHKPKLGRPTALSDVEERVLVDLLVLMGEFNYPVTKRNLKDMVKNYLDQRRDSRHD
jgi:hypothetical protein